MSSYTDPFLKSILESTVSEYSVDLLVSNLKGFPVHTRVGSNDKTVLPFYTMKMNRLLRENGVKYTTELIEGKEHWWWDTIKENDGGVINDSKMRKKYKDIYDIYYRRELNVPKKFKLTVLNPANHEGKFGIRILQLIRPFSIGTISVTVVKNVWKLSTNNVQMIRIGCYYLEPHTKFSLYIDGKKFSNEILQNYVYRKCNGNNCEWILEEIKDYKIIRTVMPTTLDYVPYPKRSPISYGPMRQVYKRPFLVIIGSNCTDEQYKRMKNYALYFVNLHYVSTYSSVPVFSDIDEIPFEMLITYNFILSIFFIFIVGNQYMNKYTKTMFRLLSDETKYPFKFNKEGYLKFKNMTFDKKGQAAALMFPISPNFFGSSLLNVEFDPYMHPNQQNRLGILLHANDRIGWNNLAKLVLIIYI